MNTLLKQWADWSREYWPCVLYFFYHSPAPVGLTLVTGSVVWPCKFEHEFFIGLDKVAKRQGVKIFSERSRVADSRRWRCERCRSEQFLYCTARFV